MFNLLIALESYKITNFFATIQNISLKYMYIGNEDE